MSESFYRRNLAVPFYTQRDNTYVWQQLYDKDEYNSKNILIKQKNQPFGPKYPMAWRTCNITSLCMILHYWGLTEETPNQIVEKIFSKTEDDWKWLYEATDEVNYPRKGAARLENWSDLKKIAELYIDGKDDYKVFQGKTTLSVKLLQDQIAKGIPVIISTGLGSVFGSGKTDGHIVVVRGFTDNDDVILNDPFGTPVGNDNRIRQTGSNQNTYGFYYGSEAASIGDNIIINKSDFEARYAAGTTKYLYIEGPLWQEPGGKETDPNNSYPIRADNMWHDGIHLESENKDDGYAFYSIGCGRLIAARNAEVETHGSSSFALVKYQLPSKDNQFFYALYMHLKKIDLAKELSDFFLTNNGNVSGQIKGTWYEQIFNNLLPRYKIINNGFGKSIVDKNHNKIYEAKLDNFKLSPTNKLADIYTNAGLLSRHTKLYLLPVKPELLKKITEIENYKKVNNLSFMIKESDSLFKDSEGYFYFFCGNNGHKELCCCKDEKIGNDNIFAIYKTFNEANYKYYTERLYKLYKGECVYFDKVDVDQKNLSENNIKAEISQIINDSILNQRVTVAPLDYETAYGMGEKYRTLFSRENDLTHITPLIHIYPELKKDINKIESYIENLLFVRMETEKFSTDKYFENILKNYKTKRETQLSAVLKKITDEINKTNLFPVENSPTVNSYQEWMIDIFTDAEEKLCDLKDLSRRGHYIASRNATVLCEEFFSVLEDYEDFDLPACISICEYILIELASIPQELITTTNGNTDRFKFVDRKNSGNAYLKLFEKWETLQIKLVNSYLPFFKRRYIDNYIEIPKGAKIGNGSTIPDSNKNNSIHFEIFSKNPLSGITEGSVISEGKDDKDNFYNAYNITKALLEGIKLPEEEKDSLLKYADDNVITKKEILNIYKTTNIFQKLVTYHQSEWVNRKYSQEDIASITASSVNVESTKETKINNSDRKEIVRALDFFNDYYNKYNWIEKGGVIEKELGPDNFYFYHPLYLIQKLLDDSKPAKDTQGAAGVPKRS